MDAKKMLKNAKKPTGIGSNSKVLVGVIFTVCSLLALSNIIISMTVDHDNSGFFEERSIQNYKLSQIEGDAENQMKTESATTTESNLIHDNSSTQKTSDDICTQFLGPSSRLTLATSSANKIWHQFIPEIFSNSQHSDDEEYAWHDFTAELLDFVTPRLKNSVKNLPILHWDKVGSILEKGFKRYKYLKNGGKLADAPPPVRILILGGSVTLGVNCPRYPAWKGTSAVYSCSWVGRDIAGINKLLGENVVDYRAYPLGGTNTKLGSMLLEYNLLGGSNEDYDIIINAYSTNDMHIKSMKDAEGRGMTLERSLLESTQEFVRAGLQNMKRCRDRKLPLFIFYNDYMGNEQQDIMTINSYTSTISQLASHYGISHFSMADLAKHVIMGDPDESWFSPNGWPERNVHPGRGFHIATKWVFMYNFLEMATTYCDMKDTNSLPLRDARSLNNLKANNVTRIATSTSPFSYWTGYAPTQGLPLKNDKSPSYPRKPFPLPFGPPPPLNENLTLINSSSKWRELEIEALAAEQSECKNRISSPCAFAFIGNLPGAFRRKQLGRLFDRVMVNNTGWGAVEDHLKIGIAALEEGAAFKIRVYVRDSDQPVKSLTILSMKSYGEKWKDSLLHVNVTHNPNMEDPTSVPITIGEMNIQGFHDKHTSEYYTHKIDLKHSVGAREELWVDAVLKGGSTFKIAGMLICDH